MSGIERELRSLRDKHDGRIMELEDENRRLRSLLAAQQGHMPHLSQNFPTKTESDTGNPGSNQIQVQVTRSDNSVLQMGVQITPTDHTDVLGPNGNDTVESIELFQRADHLEVQNVQNAVNFVLA